MDKDFALGKGNFIWIGIAIVLIVVGFVLMSGGESADGISFNPEVFNAQRIRVAPVITMVGFLLMIYGIVKRDKSANHRTNEQTPAE